MKFINDILYLEFGDLVKCGVSENTLKDAKKKGANCWRFIDDPMDKRKVLVDYEHMKEVYKKAVMEHFGNPYDRMARMPILKMVELDHKAHEYYRKHTYMLGDKEVSLTPAKVNMYTRAASWLNHVLKVKDDASIVKKGIGISLNVYGGHVKELIAVEKRKGNMEGYAGLDVLPGDFPSTPQRLGDKAKEYRDGGYVVLIDPLFGNKNASKIGRASFAEKATAAESVNVGLLPVAAGINVGLLPENSSTALTMTGGKRPINEGVKPGIGPKSGEYKGGYCPDLAEKQMAVIRAIAANGRNLDAGQVTEMVNSIFKLNGWKTLTRARIHDIISENMDVLTAGRQGKRKHMSTVAMQVKRKAPDMPMKYWTLDGWTVELLFQERGAKGIEYKRMVVVVVLDAFNKYPVGYAIGERENAELIHIIFALNKISKPMTVLR